MEGDNENEMPWWNKWAKVDSDNIDCIISNSKFLTFCPFIPIIEHMINIP
jgi:hypothetical protein